MKSQPNSILSYLVLTAIFGISGCTTVAVNPEVPNILAVPAGQTLLLEAMATGVQIYECKMQSDNPSKFEWVFKAPEADLYDSTGNTVAHHYAGPTWEAYDGSKVVGEVKTKYPGPDAKAIPWLLLNAKSNSGKGILAQAASIQRLDTRGGQAPAEVCNQALLGKKSRVPYTAVYKFYRN